MEKEKIIPLDEKFDEDIKRKEKFNKVLTKFKIKENEENEDQVKKAKMMKSLLGQKISK
jgi:hypothetical protein